MPELDALLVLDWRLFAVASAVVVFAAIAQSSIGIGFGIVAAPVLAVVDPALVPGPVLVLPVSTSAFVLLREPSGVQLGQLGPALAGRVIFSILGGLTASLLPEEWFLLVFGALMLAAVALSLSGLKVRATPRTLFVAGSASGYMGTITSVGTPPMAIVYQYSPGAEVRANMSAFLVAGGIISILSLAGFGAFGWADLLLSVKLVPAMLLGFWLSGPLRRYTDAGWMRPFMLALCVGASVLLVVRGLQGLAG